MSEKQYTVAYSANEFASNGERGYWSKTQGWCEYEEATRFPWNEVKDTNPPISTGMDAKWVKVDLPYEEDHDVDEITVAYIAFGYAKAFAELNDDETSNLTRNEGQSETVAKVVIHARFLDFVFDLDSQAFDSLSYYYEIAEPFGCEYTKALARNEGLLDRDDYDNLAVKVLKEVCMKALPEEMFVRILQHV